MKTIVVGYDGSAEADLALERAAELAQAFSARLVVATVREPYLSAMAVAPMGGVVAAPLGLEAMGMVEDETLPPGQSEWERRLAGVRERLAGEGLEAVTTAAIGRPIDELVEVADEHGADLIVVGTHEPGLMERIFAGSVSQAVARRAHCDVLVVHPHGRRAARAA